MLSAGRRLRVAVPLVVVALAAAAPHAQADPEPDRLPVTGADNTDLAVATAATGPDETGAVVAFWAAYAGRADLRKAAAILDARLRAQGPVAEPARQAVRMLVAHARGDHRRAWAERLELLDARVDPANAQFVTAALTASDRALGITRAATVSSAPGAYNGHVPAAMADGDTGTYYWSAGAPTAGTQLTLDLGRVRPIEGVAVAMGTAARPRDYLRAGVLEGSVDGVGWTPVRSLPGRPTVAADLASAPRDLRYLRLRATADQRNWLAVREFSVRPAPADACTDGDATTGYPLTGGPLVVTVGPARALDRIVVLASAGTAPGAPVQLRDETGRWRTIGRLGGQYTDLSARGLVAGQLRLVAPEGSTGAAVREIVVHPAE
ncbi:discoidin domain-containing protein [Actinokineospora sp. NBRC 105648]|uniref:discoidin domain-containing protein n=1 Tax=Actinokineospora sp. NBRC 105648 TaxID=3032206 RepID=UPI00249FFD86|nr:discoidin domain-containing protein [Actinokineospora sp. NBRC 105648]GLZ41732.1 hypothetical protein Acsp05_53560 [Actinokineospora sp. NBRC 105648]